VLWFAEVQRRRPYRQLGHASLQLYATQTPGFSENRYYQFKRLAADLDRLPGRRELELQARQVRFEALIEKAHKLGLVPTGADRLDLVLAGLEAVVAPAADGYARPTGPATRIVVRRYPIVSAPRSRPAAAISDLRRRKSERADFLLWEALRVGRQLDREPSPRGRSRCRECAGTHRTQS
jgi:hypothetical protein